MAATAKVDIIEASRIVERSGQIMELDRIYHFSDLDTTSPSGVLTDALKASPETGSCHPEHDGSDGKEATTLMLEDRVVFPVSVDQARVTLTYRWNPTVLTFVDASGSIEQTVSQQTEPAGKMPKQIVLTHPELPNDYLGNKEQGGEINITQSRAVVVGIVTLSLTGGFEQAAIHVQNWVNTINIGGFITDTDDRQWIVSDGSFEPVARDTSGKLTKARFTFTFQQRQETWQPITVYAIRPIDGLPYPNAETVTGATVVIDNWYTETNLKQVAVMTGAS